MATTIGIRFPLGRYHATPWDRSVNEGAVEWPPSPWRLLRALVATWYTRWPELPARELDGLLEALGEPPAYRTPAGRPGHTRHYLPDLEHRKGETGRTDLTLDPYLSLPRDAELLVRWEVELSADQRANLAKLAELLPYLGRADSVCVARLLDGDPEPDGRWWRPGGPGAGSIRLLAPTRPVQRGVLEVTTLDVRKERRTMPGGTQWLTYRRELPEPGGPPTRAARRRPDPIEALRFAVVSNAPVMATHGVLLADALHYAAASRLDTNSLEPLLGGGGAATGHRHAHWIPIPSGTHAGAVVDAVVVWVPDGMSPEDVARLARIRKLSGRRGQGAYEVRGLPEVELVMQSAGSIAQVIPELTGPARRWHSLTPYLPVRHRKRETLDEYVETDVLVELGYRNLPSAQVSRSDPESGLSDRWAREFRRYRLREHLGKARQGLALRLEFAEPVAGPLLLGQLSHFGYGIFTAKAE